MQLSHWSFASYGNCFVYWTTQFLCAGRRHFDLTTDFDRWVPVQSWWVLIYVASFAFWVICYILIARFNDREFWFRFVTGRSPFQDNLRSCFRRFSDHEHKTGTRDELGF